MTVNLSHSHCRIAAQFNKTLEPTWIDPTLLAANSPIGSAAATDARKASANAAARVVLSSLTGLVFSRTPITQR